MGNLVQASVIVVSNYEGAFLKKCLPPLRFCDERILVSLGTDPLSESLAKANGFTFKVMESVSFAEKIHLKIHKTCKHDWILIIDPDEVISDQAASLVSSLVKQDTDNGHVGAYGIPIQFYCKSHKLKGTHWGGINHKHALIHRKRFRFTDKVHSRNETIPPFIIKRIKRNGDNCIHHYWITSYRVLFQRSLRYLKEEGRARYANQGRRKILALVLEPYRSFKHSYIDKKGYLDGWIGFGLSMFWAIYNTAGLFQQLRYQWAHKSINKA